MYRRLVKMQHFANTSKPYKHVSVLTLPLSKEVNVSGVCCIIIQIQKRMQVKNTNMTLGIIYYVPVFPLYVLYEVIPKWVESKNFHLP